MKNSETAQNSLLSLLRKDCREIFTLRRCFLILLGTLIFSFGLYNVHAQTNITEGGALGMILLLEHWFGLQPSIASPLIDLVCYLLSAKALGRKFVITSLFSTISMSLIFRVLECFPPTLPNLSDQPLLAAVLGALFIGIGVGIVIRSGGSCGGDDALALFISKMTGWRISRSYLVTDLTVLTLSLTYIPAKRIFFSLITVTISSYLVDFIKSFDFAKLSAKRSAG